MSDLIKNKNSDVSFTKKILYYVYLVIGTVGLVAIDRLTKYLAVTKLKGSEPFVIIKDVFELQYLENRGAAFGMLQGQRWLFVVITVLFVLAAVFFYGRIKFTKKNIPLHVIICFLLSGAVGNFIDRIRFVNEDGTSYVVDFFYFKLINFPIFNVADIYVSVSVVVLIVLILFFYKEEPENKKEDK